MNAFDALAARTVAVRRTPLGSLALRATIGAAALTGTAATVLAPWETPTALIWMALAAGFVAAAIPDSLAATMYVLAVGGSWAILGDDAIDGWLVTAVLSALVVHTSCAFASSMPLDCDVRWPVVRRWLVSTAGLALVTLVGLAGLALLSGGDLGGAVWLTLSAIVGVALLVWWWAS